MNVFRGFHNWIFFYCVYIWLYITNALYAFVVHPACHSSLSATVATSPSASCSLRLLYFPSQYNSRAIWPIPSTLWQHSSQWGILFACLFPFWVSSPTHIMACNGSTDATLFVVEYLKGVWQAYTLLRPTGTPISAQASWQFSHWTCDSAEFVWWW